MADLNDLFADEEARLIAEANTPARIAADRALAERNRRKAERELAALQACGMIDEGGEPDDDEETDDEFTV